VATLGLAETPVFMPDLDRDGIAEVAVVSERENYHRVDVWLSSRGGRDSSRKADIVATESFADQIEVFVAFGAVEDIDGDGLSEITARSVVLDSVGGVHVPVVSVYSSTFGRPMSTFFGTGVETIQFVLSARAAGDSADDLLLAIPTESYVRPEFSLLRSSSGSSESYGSSGSSDSSSPSSASGGWYVDKGVEAWRISWALYDPLSARPWSFRIGQFIGLSYRATAEAKKRFPNDDGRQNALRHALWQIFLTCTFDAETARKIGDIHEEVFPNPCDTAIDQFNNAMARDLAAAGLCKPFEGSLDDLLNELVRRMNEGDFIISPTDPRVTPPCP
jgi:hypothetical protein